MPASSTPDSHLCLTANQTSSILASDIDPGTRGYLVAVAVDGGTGRVGAPPGSGVPINFNWLIGDEYVKLPTGHAANLGAEAIAAVGNFDTNAAVSAGSVTVPLSFSGVPCLFDGNPANSGQLAANRGIDTYRYMQLPAVLALDNFASNADGNSTNLYINAVNGSLQTGVGTTGVLFGTLYDDAENVFSFQLPGGCQATGTLGDNYPRTTPRLSVIVPAGRSGWFKLWSQTFLNRPLLGAAIVYNPNATTQGNAFNQGHNLHKLTLSSAGQYTIPVFPPAC